MGRITKDTCWGRSCAKINNVRMGSGSTTSAAHTRVWRKITNDSVRMVSMVVTVRKRMSPSKPARL